MSVGQLHPERLQEHIVLDELNESEPVALPSKAGSDLVYDRLNHPANVYTY